MVAAAGGALSRVNCCFRLPLDLRAFATMATLRLRTILNLL
jgi:hypothetical protein